LAKDDFLDDKRTQQAVVLNSIILGEAARKIMEGYAAFAEAGHLGTMGWGSQAILLGSPAGLFEVLHPPNDQAVLKALASSSARLGELSGGGSEMWLFLNKSSPVHHRQGRRRHDPAGPGRRPHPESACTAHGDSRG
jgi:hypothetical protein